MAISDLKLFSMLRSKMHWHQARQKVLAENVANADSPNYDAKDLKAFDVDTMVDRRQTPGLETRLTSSQHLKGRAIFPNGMDWEQKSDGFEVTPEGNNVSLEEQMMKVTANQMDYQAVASLYSKGLGMIRTAAGKG
ncbi:flagellar basal body rod protein FlgB [uncultured Cohaesibacter sp.]|uniref:flagellar basal body rod protein FlgB n=1 Tax=uncultured Cohaesibacter sp. TaxID=1002546 RepID=UPI00292EE063|nr:flagellar basal body rod protein FlgB [uncultured Cohaesibacter sp.]